MFSGTPFKHDSKLLAVFYPKAATIGDTPSPGTLFTPPGSGYGTERFSVFDFVHYSGLHGDFLKEIRHTRADSLSDGSSLTGWRVLESFDYHADLIGGIRRIQKRTGPYGESSTFSYDVPEGQSHVKKVTKIDLRGTVHVWDHLDLDGRPGGGSSVGL